MSTPPGFAHIIIPLKHVNLNRPAAVTFAVDSAETDPNDIADSAITAFAATGSITSLIDSNVTVGPASAYLGTDGAPDIVGVGALVFPGLWTTQSGPPNCAVLIHKNTARGGRRGKGRMYLPWSAGFMDFEENGNLLTARKNTVNTAFGVFLTQLAITPGPMVVLHKPSIPGTEHPTPVPAPSAVTSYRVDGLVASQRRRVGR